MKLYNSLTKSVDDFEPAGDVISIYSCGPTVYKSQHIGNISSFIYADTLRRVLQLNYPDKKIKHVINFTDVDDKTIKGALEAYPDLDPKDSLKKLTREIEEKVLADLDAVGVDLDSIEFVRATDHIEQMQKLIKALLDQKVAYVTEDGIYFSIEKYKSNGRKYGQLVEVTAESTGAARVDNDEYEKDEIHDFVLWKAHKDGEPAWDFEVDGKNIAGRPGWHIECSAMSTEYLGQPFDIHTGGVDLKFPHHENEIAQSTAGEEEHLAKFFFHSEHLLIDGARMAKREDNFYTLDDIDKKGYDPLAFRVFVLTGHYQKQLNFSWEALDGAQARLNNIRNYVEFSMQQDTDEQDIEISSVVDNLHTPKLLESLDFTDENPGLSISKLDALLGLKLNEIEDAPKEVYELIIERETARKNKDFDTADSARDKLKDLGFTVNDSASGPIWQRIY